MPGSGAYGLGLEDPSPHRNSPLRGSFPGRLSEARGTSWDHWELILVLSGPQRCLRPLMSQADDNWHRGLVANTPLGAWAWAKGHATGTIGVLPLAGDLRRGFHGF